VLGAMLIDRQACETVALKPDDFYDPTNAEIFTVMRGLIDANAPVDFVTLSTELSKTQRLDAVGGYEYLAHLSTFIPSSANVDYYTGLVLEASRLRGIIQTANNLAMQAYDGESSADALAEGGIQLLSQLALGSTASQNRSIGQVAADTYGYLEDVHAGKVQPMQIGMPSFDAITGGFHKGELTVLGARPGVGKSAWAMHVADKLARKGFKVLFFSREMADIQYGMRALSRESGVSSATMRNGRLQDAQWLAVADAAASIYTLPLYINNRAARPSEIAQACREMRHKIGLDLVVVDYLQLVEPDGRHENRVQAVAEVSRAMKMLTFDNVAVLALSQLSRPPKGSTARPTMQDLRESGAIEQDADNILLQHMPEEQPNPEVRRIEMQVAKQRMGDLGTIKLAFRPAQMQYTAIKEGA
jgi:replicative DNA helicase